MYQEIVVPLNGDESAERAWPSALELSRRWGATLVAYSMVFDHVQRIERLTYLDSVTKNLGDPDIIPRVGLGGDPVEAILEQLSPPGQLLCMAMGDTTRVSELLIGSTTTRLVIDATSPLFVVGPDCTDAARCDLGSLIVALDGTAAAEPAVPLALAWAKGLGLPVKLVRVADNCGPSAMNGSALELAEGRYLEQAAASFSSAGVVATWELLFGRSRRHVVEGLAKCAASTPGSVIVLTPTRRAGDVPVLGRVTRRTLYHSPVPVLLARERG